MIADTLLTYKEVARRLGGICTKTVKRMVQSGELPPAVQVRKVPTIPESELAQFIEQMKNKRGEKHS
jgi:excisionase family DNA binding protein